MAKNVVSRIDRNLARRLREARREVGYSLRMVASKLPSRLSLSHTTLASYENGVSVPPIHVLAMLAELYARPVNWFLDDREMLTGFRYLNIQSRVPLSDQRQFAAVAAKWADAYIGLERHLKHRRMAHTVDAASSTPEQLANKVRTEVLNLDDAQPVLSTVAVLESFSTWAIELRPSFNADGATAKHGERRVIVLNPQVSTDRVRLNAAQELFNVLLDRSTDDTRNRLDESQAFTFAVSFLLPESQLRDAFEGRSFLRLLQFKERFGVSLAAMIHRATSLRIINSTASRWLWSQMARKGWRQSEPGCVWRDRAISFETLLETAIHKKQIDWSDAERITSIPQHDLKRRLNEIANPPAKEEPPPTIMRIDCSIRA